MTNEIIKVLLIDDDELSIFLNKTIMEMSALILAENINSCLNGGEAINYLDKRHNLGEHGRQLIFLDLNMPLMDGWEFMEEYNKRPYSIAPNIIIVLSASPNPADETRARETENVMEFMQKPLTIKGINSIVNKYFRPADYKTIYDQL